VAYVNILVYHMYIVSIFISYTVTSVVMHVPRRDKLAYDILSFDTHEFTQS